MASFAVSCHHWQSEGINPLKQLFEENHKLNIKWYNKLIEEDIDWDDLIKGSEKNLREMLKEDCQFKGKAILRIINAMSEISESRIYKDLNAVKVSVISSEESKAMENIQAISAVTKEIIKNIRNTMQSLNVNSKLSENIINNNCDGLIKIINQRREKLLRKLQRMTELKHNKLLNQQNSLTQQVQTFDGFYQKMQTMVKDTTMHSEKRKIKILSQTKEILQNYKQNEKDLILVTNDTIHIEMDMNMKNITHLLSTIGAIYDGTGALPPIIHIKKVKQNAAIISIEKNDKEKEPKAVAVAVVTQWDCPKCSTTNEMAYTFCPKCGCNQSQWKEEKVEVAPVDNVILLKKMSVINDGTYSCGEKRQTGWIVKNISKRRINVKGKLVKFAGSNDVVLNYDDMIQFDMKAGDEMFVMIQVKAPLMPKQYHIFCQLLNDENKQRICEVLPMPVVVKSIMRFRHPSDKREKKIRQIGEMGFLDREKIVVALKKWNWDLLKATNWLATHKAY